MQLKQLLDKLSVDLDKNDKDINLQTKNKFKIDNLTKKYQNVQTEVNDVKIGQKKINQKIQNVEEN